MAESKADAPMTRESLMSGWDNIEELSDATEPEQDASPDGVVDDENLQDQADAQSEGDVESEDQAADELPETMRLYDFAKGAGWKLDEFYGGVTVPINGQEVKVGEAINSIETLNSQVDGLSRERDELRERLQQTAVQGPAATPQVDPEAQEMMILAGIYEKQLADPNAWNGLDDGTVSRQQLHLMNLANQLKQQAQQKQNEHLTKLQEQSRQQYEEYDKQVRQTIKTWADPKVRAQDEQANRDFVSNFGFKPEEYDNVMDPRMKAMIQAHREATTKVKKVETRAKEVRKVPKVLPAGARAALDAKVDLKDVKQRIGEAKSREEKQKLRLTMPLG